MLGWKGAATSCSSIRVRLLKVHRHITFTNMPPTVIGIDLGTTFSLAAYMDKGKPVVVRDENGVALVPSVLSFHDDGTVLVGSEARARCLSDPDHTVFSVKRLMGRTLDDLKQELPLIPYQVVER